MDDEDTVTVVGIVLMVVDILTVVGRFYSRWYTKSGFGWDDWTILIALLLSLLAGILTIYGVYISARAFRDDPLIFNLYVPSPTLSVSVALRYVRSADRPAI